MLYDDNEFPLLMALLKQQENSDRKKDHTDNLPHEDVLDGIDDLAEEIGVNLRYAERELKKADPLFDLFDQVERMQTHISQYGVSKDFWLWTNRNDALVGFLKLQSVPALESFDTVGDPTQPFSIACQEALGEIAGNIWKFIKSVCEKIKNFIIGVGKAIIGYATKLEPKINKAKKFLATRVPDPSKANDTFKGIPLQNLKGCVSNLQSRDNEINQLVTKVQSVASNAAQAAPDQLKQSVTEIEGIITQLQNYSAQFKKEKPKLGELKIGNNPIPVAMSYLDFGLTVIKAMTNVNNQSKKIIAAAETIYKAVDAAANKSTQQTSGDQQQQAATGQGTGNAIAKVADKANKAAQGIVSLVRDYQWVAASAYAAATQLGAATKDKNEGANTKQENQAISQQNEGALALEQ